VNDFVETVGADKSDPSFIKQLEKAVNLYLGSFLEGFSLEDSSVFEEWTLLTRVRLARQASSALHALAETHELCGEYERAQFYLWRQLELEPWDEAAHQRLMRVLALSDQRSAALAQYATCRKTLAEELGVEPAEETKKLYEQIRDGNLKTLKPSSITETKISARLPLFLEKEPSHVEASVIVAREHELSQLNKFLEQSLTRQGKVVFVTGEAGSGKTSLLAEFSQSAVDKHTNLVIASGNCNAYTGIGDPYLPFREILELLTGEVESKWAAGAISREHALRLWNGLPVAIQALVEAGPDLMDTFIQRAALRERAGICASGQPNWLTRLDELLDRKPATILSSASLHQVDLFEQYVKVLQALEEQSPLLLIIDDLQWADAGSINLLFHLGRRLAGSRILVLCAYRSEEIALGRGGTRHPLEPVINEFRRMFGAITVHLPQTQNRDFVDALLDSEPNHLEVPFRDMLYQQTQGHPLFTIELLRGLQERGDIVKDSQNYWIAGPSLDWGTLPARVEAAIQERIGRLPEGLQKALEVASVEGELFTAEVVARVRGMDAREMLEHLSSELDRKHRLVRAQSIQRVDGQLVSRYQFRHILFQKYLYNSLDEVVRVHLHEQVGTNLETLYGSQENATAVAVQLARHFEEARIVDRAVHYLLLAGSKAVRLSAFQEAIAHLSRGLTILEVLPKSTECARQELDLQLAYSIALQGAHGAQAPGLENVLMRARELCQQVGNTSQMVQVLGGLAVLNYVRAEYRQAGDLAEEALNLARTTEDLVLISLCHWYHGFILFCLGEHSTAREHLKHVIDFYKPEQHHLPFISLRGSDAGLGALAYDACCLWCLGYPDQALKRSQEAISLAQALGHPLSLADVLSFAGCAFNSMRRNSSGLIEYAEKLMELSRDRHLGGWYATGVRYFGEALVFQLQENEGIAKMREGLEGMRSEGVLLYCSETFGYLAEAQAKAGNLEEGLATVDEAFTFIERTKERYWEAELYRLKGELLLKKGEEAEAETNFYNAIMIARKQSAKSLELRAVISSCRLWQRWRKKSKAKKMLAEIYNWFTEGFDTPDLIEANKLLEELS
jgi:predicted ATPase